MRFHTALIALALILVLAVPGFSAEVRYAGSTTLAEVFFDAGNGDEAFTRSTGVAIRKMYEQKEFSGTGNGIAAVIAGTADIAGSGRLLKEEEKAKGAFGITVAFDALAVFVNRDNPVTNLTKAQLKGLFTGAVKDWSGAGGKSSPVHLYTEPLKENRATTQMLNELAMDKAPFGAIFSESADHVKALEAVSKDAGGVRVASIGLLNSLSPGVKGALKVVPVEGIAPTDGNILAGTYLLSRPMVLVTKGAPAGDAKRFVDFLLSWDGQAILEKGFLPVKRAR